MFLGLERRKYTHSSRMIRGVLLGLVTALVYWWSVIYFQGYVGNIENYLWVVLLTFIPIIGGVYGLYLSQVWGGWKSVFGKGVILLSLGLIGWSTGDIIWSYYNLFLQVEIPYPGWADLGFFSIVPFWFVGMLYIARAGGATFALKKTSGKLLVVTIPLVVFVVSYFLFLQDKTLLQEDFLKMFFDIAFPLGDALTASVALSALLLMARFLGGRMRLPIMVLIIGFVFQYLADFSFSYTSTVETYFNANWVDLLYLLAQFTVSYGVASLVPDGA